MENILHISDLHVSTNPRYGLHFSKCLAIAEKTALDANQLIRTHGKAIDTIIFSGDIAFSGKEEEYEKALEFFINPLLKILELNLDDLYICPGNHDSDRSEIDRFEHSYRKTATLQEINDLAKDIINDKLPWKRITAYNNFRRQIDSTKKNVSDSNNLYTSYKMSERLYLLCLSSAWLAQDDEDKGNLLITESQIKAAVKSVPNDSAKILVIHHPINWITQEDSNQVSAVIEKKINIQLFGHMHEFDQSIDAKFSEDITLRLQAGTLDPTEKNPGYSVISLQNKNNIKYGKIIYRKYCHESNGYVEWNERGRNGEFDFSTDGAITFDSEKFSALSQKVLEKADKEILINTGLNDVQKKSVRDLFILPNLNKPDCIDIFQSIKPIRSFDELLSFSGIAIVSGGVKRGKSFALQYIYTKKLEKQTSKSFADIVFHMDAKSKDLNSKSKIIQTLCMEYIDQDLATSFEKKIKQSINDGCATIIIDNFCDARTQEQKAIIEFIQEHNKCNYIISTSTTNEISLIRNFADRGNIVVGATAIGVLKRTNIRQIVSKWAPLIAFDTEDRIFSDVMRVVRNSQLPHNHFIYSMLLAIYENKRELKGILNEADVIENFIEILLRKHFINTSPQHPQYKELLHFLGYLCHTMTLDGVDSLDRNELLRIALEFNQKTLFSYQVELYIEPFITSGILSPTPPYQFSQTCFFDFGTSYYMSHSLELKDFVFRTENYLKHDKTIEYYASNNPSSLEALIFIKEKTSLAIEVTRAQIKAEHQMDMIQLDLNNIDNISFLDIASTSEQFEKKVSEIKADRPRHDEMMDKLHPLETEQKSTNRLTPLSSDFPADNISTLKENLSLYARIFRSTELIMNPAETISFFEDIVTGYINLIKALICRMDEEFIIPVIISNTQGGLFPDELTNEQKDEFIASFKTFISIVKSVIPNHVQNLMSENLTSRKPRLHNIINKVVEANNSDIMDSLLICLLLDIEHGDIKKHIKSLIDINSKFSKTNAFFKIMQLLTNRHDLPEETRTFLSKSAVQLVSKNKEGLGQRLQMFKKGIDEAISKTN